jgi:hypothetical protein
MSKIIHISGLEIPEPGTPVASVVEGLKKLMAAALDGQIKGLAVVATHFDECTTWHRWGFANRSTIGALELVKADLVEQSLKEEL